MTRSSTYICPYCGASGVTSASCSECGGLQDPESRQATAAELGPWYKRDPDRPFFMGCSMARMAWMIRTGHVSRRSIIRGPTTEGFWMRADRVAGIAHLFGICHACGERVHPKQKICAACQSPLFIPPKVGHEPPIIPLNDQPSPSETDSATASISLVSRAQYRRIERLQNTVRLQIILLALTISLLCACLFIIFFFMDRKVGESPQATSLPPDPPARIDRDPLSGGNVGDVGARIAGGSAGPDPDTDPASPPVPQAALPADDPDVELGSAAEYGDRTLEEVLEVMRDVTPEQDVLLRKLRVQLDRAENPDAPVQRRRRAIERARELIDEALRTETDDFFRARLAALRGEFDSLEDALPSESVAP